MEKDQLNILGRLNKEELTILKEEAENCIQNQADSEEIILSKANNLFQVLIVILVSVIGYFISHIHDKSYALRDFSIILCIFLITAISFLTFAVWPRNILLKGTRPDLVLFDDIFDGSCEQTNGFLKNRIFNLNKAILLNTKSQQYRVRLYKYSFVSVLVGILSIFIYFLWL